MIYSYCMNVYFALALNFIPFLLCFFLFKFLFKMKFSTELFACLFGFLSVLPITFLQFYLMSLVPEQLFAGKTDLGGLFCKFLVYNGLVEELIKVLLIALIPHKKLNLRAFFAASLLCGLCLGSFESMIYFLQHLSEAKQSGAELLYNLIFARMFSSDLIHVFCAGLGGLFVWGLRHKKNNPMILIYAVVCHGLFDFFVYFDLWIHWFAVATVLFAVIECRVKYQGFAALASAGKFEKKPDFEKTKARGARRKTSAKRNSAKSSVKNDVKVDSDATVVTENLKTPAKTKTRIRTKTKVKAENKSSDCKEKIPENLDVTPELNEEI